MKPRRQTRRGRAKRWRYCCDACSTWGLLGTGWWVTHLSTGWAAVLGFDVEHPTRFRADAFRAAEHLARHCGHLPQNGKSSGTSGT